MIPVSSETKPVGSTSTVAPKSAALTDIFIAVHGIGEQNRNSTVQAVATQLARATVLGKYWSRPPVAPQPLGYFQGSDHSAGLVSPIATAAATGESPVAIGLAEVYWADIPREVVEEGRTLEETKAWARTVVARAQALYEQALDQERTAGLGKADAAGVSERLEQVLHQWKRTLTEPDFGLAGEVLDQIIETIYVLENLLFVARKTGVLSLDLTGLLNDFLGDVQLVTEFASHRLDVIARFQAALERIYDEQKAAGNGQVRLHVIAHSEGTVVSFLGLLHALCGHRIQLPDAKDGRARLVATGAVPPWLGQVRSYLTIGSPIDKHLLLWEHLWEGLDPLPQAKAVPIRWRNYYDVGDPVGFRLDTARLWLAEQKITAFEFEEAHDIGFSRYLVPGKAHVDYWTDHDLFAHYLTTAAFARDEAEPAHSPRLQLEPAPPPRSRGWVRWLAPTLPYLLSTAVLIAGVGLAGQAVAGYILPVLSPSDNYTVRAELGLAAPEWDVLTFRNVLGVSLLIAGVTLLARLPRLAAGFRWKFAGLEAFLLGALSYGCLVDYSVQREIGYLFSLPAVLLLIPTVFWLALGSLGKGWARAAVVGALGSVAAGYYWHARIFPMTSENEYVLSIVGTWLVALTVGLTGLAVTRRSRDRRSRWLLRGMRPLMLTGTLVVVAMVWKELLPISLEEIESRKGLSFEVDYGPGLPAVHQIRLNSNAPDTPTHPRYRRTLVEQQAEYDL